MMKLSTTKDLENLRPVLKDPHSLGPDPVYWVFSGVSKDKWANVTIIVPGKLGTEYLKTFGHYHGVSVNETYHVVYGEGTLLMQKKHLEDGKWIPEMVDEVLLVRAKAFDEVVITPEYGHSWSNVGRGPLIFFDNWREEHTPADYEEIKRLQGLAYYLIEEGDQPKPVPNSNYRDLPEPIWLTAEEFREKQMVNP